MTSFMHTPRRDLCTLTIALIAHLFVGSGCGESGEDGTESTSPCSEDCSLLRGPGACEVGYCDAESGVCSIRVLADGEPCSEHDETCLVEQVCRAGVCEATPMDCSYLDLACQVGVCSSDTCTREPRENGTPCEDANACTIGDICTDGACRGVASVQGNRCPDAIPLTSADGLHVIDGQLDACHSNAFTVDSLFCSPDDGRGSDVVYSITVPRHRFVDFRTLDPETGFDYDTILHLRESSCVDRDSEEACDDDDRSRYFSTIEGNNLAAGVEHFLVVDTDESVASGDYRLEVDIYAPNTCERAPSIRPPSHGRIYEIRGDLDGATDDFSPADDSACAPGGVDHVYSITNFGSTRLSIEVRTEPGSIPVSLELRSIEFADDCSDALDVPGACSSTGREGDSRSAGLIEGNFSGGSPVLVVEAPPSYDGSGNGNYTINVRKLPDVDFGEADAGPLRGSAAVGTEYTNGCGEGWYVAGLHGVTDLTDGSILRLGEVCRRSELSTTDATRSYALTGDIDFDTLRGFGTGLEAVAICPEGEAVVGFSGRTDVALTRLELKCAPITARSGLGFYWYNLYWTIGDAEPLLPIGGSAGLPFEDYDCPAGTIAVGTTIKAGTGVSGFGLHCAELLE